MDLLTPKMVYVVSDGTGQSAITVMRASMVQFNSATTNLRIFSRIDSEEKVRGVLDQAAEDGAFVAFTIAKKHTRELVHQICHHKALMHHDILGPPLEKLSVYLGSTPREDANLLRKVDDKYFKRIEAIEFTMKYDDGQDAGKAAEADIIILGPSRTSKTPTSFFLAQQGYKVVNIPLVPEVPLPNDIYDVDQSKIVCLVMDPEVLQKVRDARLKHYRTRSNYSELKRIFDEMEMVHALIKKNRQWRKIDTTNKSVEETAREIISMMFGQAQSF
ncbi:MAG: kinase/pyrophosphorylase [Desulfuromonas sp.]|nr:MAG: kinase/pyrophosphorylase [Desulfuromonas sp.]